MMRPNRTPSWLRSLLKSRWVDLLVHPDFARARTLEAIRARLLAVAGLLLCLSAPAVAWGYIKSGEYTFAALFGITGFLALMSFVVIKRWTHTWLSAHLASMSIMVATFVGIYALGGADSPAARWFAVVPIVGGVFGGVGTALFWFLLSVLAYIGLVVAPSFGFVIPEPTALATDPGHLTRAMVTFMTFTLLLFVVEELLRAWMLDLVELQEERTRRVIEHAPDGVLLLGEAGITHANPIAREMLTHGLEETALADITATDSQALRIESTDGTSRFMEVSSAVLPGDDRGDLERVVIVRDVTERKRIEAELERALELSRAAAQAKSQFLANMSHELRTPLNAVIGYAELMLEDERPQEQDILAIRDAGRHLLHMISDIMDLNRLEDGALTPESIEFDLDEVLESLSLQLQPTLQEHANELSVHNSLQISRVLGDRARVRQLLWNLLDNAARFTHQGHVRLRTTRLDTRRVLLEVEDTGVGMSKDELDHAFGAFTQVDATSTRVVGGTGIGLALVERLTHAMHGNLEVESTPGEGTHFRIELPLPEALEG